MITINFAAFPVEMSRKGARKVLGKFDSTARLPSETKKLLLLVPESGTVVFENLGNDFFRMTAVPMGQEVLP